MVQENAANTYAEMKDYPTPHPLNRIGIKVGLGMGLLLSLFVIAALVSLYQARIVDEKVREITEVAEPTSAAAYEMEINVIGTGLGVLKYLQTGDAIHRQRVAKDEVDFERFKAQYDLLAETPRGREQGDRISLLYQQYKALGETLMDQADQQEVLFATIGENFKELDDILDEKIQANVDLQDPDGAEKLKESVDMEADIAEVGNWLGSYLRTPREEYKERLNDEANDFWEELDRFKSFRLTEQEQDWAVELEDLFSQTQALSTEIIALDADIAANLVAFVDLRTKLDAILDDEIQVLTHQDLTEATQVAHDMEARTTTAVLLLLLVGMACGTFVTVAITRSITRPVGKLLSASQAIAKGDLSQRVDVQTKDEFGILGGAFNEMIVQRQLAYEELEIRVQERTAELTRASEAKSEFLAHMSHELRTPLNSALGFAQLLKEDGYGSINATQQQFVEGIMASGSHLLQLITDIIDISRVEAGIIQLDVKDFDVRAVLSDCCKLAAGMAANKSIAFQVKYPPKGTVIYGDKVRVMQIVLNLLNNAFKFTPAEGRVNLTGFVVGQNLNISVEDDGIGIEEEFHQRIFNLFERGPSEIAKQFSGLGLGLPLVKELAELHGGRVSLVSKLQEGSCFTVTLPMNIGEIPMGSTGNNDVDSNS